MEPAGRQKKADATPATGVVAAVQLRAVFGLKAPEGMITGSAALSRAELVIGNDGTFGRLNARSRLALITRRGRYAVPGFLRLDDDA